MDRIWSFSLTKYLSGKVSEHNRLCLNPRLTQFTPRLPGPREIRGPWGDHWLIDETSYLRTEEIDEEMYCRNANIKVREKQGGWQE